MNERSRTLTDADVEAIAARLESRLADRLVRGAGSGAIAVVKRLILWVVVGLAAYALAHGWRP